MRALSLWQPWASLMAYELKLIETRGWETSYRGPLAIQAAKRWSAEQAELCRREPFRSALAGVGRDARGMLPLGAVVCVGELRGCDRIRAATELPPEPERSFGDYSLGRYMWRFAGVERPTAPIPAQGRQGLFELVLPEDAFPGQRNPAHYPGAAALVESLMGLVCPACGRAKGERASLCGRCYFRLPPLTRRALYKRVGEGYEEAIAAAMRSLAVHAPSWPRKESA